MNEQLQTRLNWTPAFDTGIAEVDEQHQQLVRLLGVLYDHCLDGKECVKLYDKAVELLIAYAEIHFRDEESLMRKNGLDERHIRKHVMEHKSFAYDVTSMRNRISPLSW